MEPLGRVGSLLTEKAVTFAAAMTERGGESGEKQRVMVSIDESRSW